MVVRATREDTEILATGAGDARATRQDTEILATGAGDARATRQDVEILVAVAVSFDRVTRTQGEVLTDELAGDDVRVSRVQAEILTDDAIVEARLTQQHISAAATGPADLRLTQQHVSAAATGPANLRLTQQDVAVGATGPGQVRVTQQFVLAAVLFDPLVQTTSNTITFAQNAVGTVPGLEQISNTITFTQQIDTNQKFASANNTAAFAQTATFNLVADRSAQNTIAFQQKASFEQILETPIVFSQLAVASKENPITQVISFVQQVQEVAAGRPVSNTIVFNQQAVGDGPVSASASNTLELEQVIRPSEVFELSVTTFVPEEILVDGIPEAGDFTQEARPGLILLSAENTDLTLLQQIADTDEKSRSVSQSILFTQEAREEADSLRVANNTLALTQQAVAVGPTILAASNTITFTQDVRDNPKKQEVSNTLALQQVATVISTNLSASNQLQLNQTASAIPGGEVLVTAINVLGTVIGDFTQKVEFDLALINRSLTSFLSFAQLAAPTETLVVSNTIVFTQELSRAVADNTLVLNQVATGVASKDTFSDFLVDDSVAFTLDPALSAKNTLTFTQTALGDIDAIALILCTYKPTLDAGSPVKKTAPTLVTPATTILLTHPFLNPNRSIEFRAPEFGNRDRFIKCRIQRRTRGGKLIVFAEDFWPLAQQLVIEVSGLKLVDTTKMREFVDRSVGQEIGLRDWEGQLWRGFITTPDFDTTETGKPLGQFRIAFEFEGVNLGC